MDEVKISQLNTNPIVCFSGKTIALPQRIQRNIDEYWQSLLDKGKTYTRGEVFTVTQVKKEKEFTDILVEKTDYAHYLYCQNIDAKLEGYGVRVIFVACLVETSDDKVIFGKMGEHTARAGIYQLAGGGIDNSVLVVDVFDLQKSISKELQEELGIDVFNDDQVHEFKSAYLNQGGNANKIAVVFYVKLNESAKEFMQNYIKFVKKLILKGEKPEFGEIVILDKKEESINDFFGKHGSECEEYMQPLLKFVFCKKSSGGIS